jgi:HNH endonuclease
VSKPRYDRTIVLPPGLAQRLAAIAAHEQLTLRALVILAARECARAYPDRFRAGKRLWSRADDRLLRAIYPHQSTASVAQRVRRSISSTNGRAKKLGLKKTAAYLASPAACRLRRGDHVGKRFWYPKGHVPANKGLRRPGWHAGRMRETQFKPGTRSGKAGDHWMPIGSTRIADGYVYRKVADVLNVPYTVNWKLEHHLVWTAAHGPIPRGHVLIFRNGDPTDVRLDNLELITRRALMARNTVHNLPKPLAATVQLLGKLNQVIRNKEARSA